MVTAIDPQHRVVLIRIPRTGPGVLEDAHDLYSATRQWWTVAEVRTVPGPRAPEYALAVIRGHVVAGYRINGWHRRADGKREFYSEPVELYTGVDVSAHFPRGAANPLRYINCAPQSGATAESADLSDGSEAATGLYGPWVHRIPQLWATLADDSPIAAPPVPRKSDDHWTHIAHWSALLTLTFGALGWARPDLGIGRWIDEGMPRDGRALEVLATWWGADAVGVCHRNAYTGTITQHSERLAWTLGLRLPAAPPASSSTAGRPVESMMTDRGGYDVGHLHHVVDHLLGEESGFDDPYALRAAIHGLDAGPDDAHLVLHTAYHGWYRTLTGVGEGLPRRSDEHPWVIEVVADHLGSLGSYRHSSVTGRWYSGSHRWHLLGWPEADMSPSTAAARRGPETTGHAGPGPSAPPPPHEPRMP